MVLLVSYDLNGKERPSAYADVKKKIEQNATSYIKPLYSQWFVETSHNPEWWTDKLREVTDANDGIFVVKVARPYSGWLHESVWEWLRERI